MSIFQQVELTSLINSDRVSSYTSKDNSIINTIKNEIKPLKKSFLHLCLLLKKNYVLQIRAKKTLFLQILSPFLVCIVIMIWQCISSSLINEVILNPEIYPTILIPKCTGHDSNDYDCSTIAYSIIVSFKSYEYIYSYLKFYDPHN